MVYWEYRWYTGSTDGILGGQMVYWEYKEVDLPQVTAITTFCSCTFVGIVGAQKNVLSSQS